MRNEKEKVNGLERGSRAKTPLARVAPVMLAIVVSFALVFQSQMPLEAARRSSRSRKALESRKKENQRQLARVRQELEKIRRQRADVGVQVEKVDNEFEKASAELNAIVRQEKIITVQHERLKQDLNVATDKFKSARQRYRGRLIGYYKDGKVKWLEVLFTSSKEEGATEGSSWNFMEFVNRVHYLGLLARRDIEVISDLRTKREVVEIKKSQVEEKKEEIAENREEQAEETTQIKVIQGLKRKELHQLSAKEENLERIERELEVQNARIEREVAALIRASGARNLKVTFTGALGNPVCNGSWRITSYFGRRRSPTRGASSNHKGIDLGISHGQSICSAAGGTVIFAGRQRGYGVTVMVAHSQDLVTLYGHGLSIPGGIRTGAVVRKGQLIMYGDSSGTSTGDHLHFTVYKNSTAVNPLGYLR